MPPVAVTPGSHKGRSTMGPGERAGQPRANRREPGDMRFVREGRLSDAHEGGQTTSAHDEPLRTFDWSRSSHRLLIRQPGTVATGRCGWLLRPRDPAHSLGGTFRSRPTGLASRVGPLSTNIDIASLLTC